MTKKYRVKLNNPEEQKECNNKGYLDGGFGRIGSYTRGDALKKARLFNGKIEEIKPTFIITEAKIAQIHENNLLDGVVKALKGREQFEDTEETLGERIYNADVFEQILGEQQELIDMKQSTLNTKTLNQLEELAENLGDYQYVQVTVI